MTFTILFNVKSKRHIAIARVDIMYIIDTDEHVCVKESMRAYLE